MRKYLFCMTLALLLVMGGIPLFALEVKGTAPTFTITVPQQAQSVITQNDIKNLNDQIGSAFNTGLDELNKQISGIQVKPENLIKAWGNASTFASQGATQRSYGGYDLFAVTLGPMIGIQLPSSPFTIADELNDIVGKLQSEGDIKLGLNPQILSGQVGVNASKFLLENLYLGVKFGYMNLDLDSLGVEGFSFNTFSLGLTAQYQWLPRKSLAAGILLWRGVTFGSGFIFQNTHVGFNPALDSVSQGIPNPNITGISADDWNRSTPKLVLTPKLAMNIDVNTFTIPLEAVTSVRLLYILNLSLGLGVDLGFGSSNMALGAEANVKAENLPKGSVSVSNSSYSYTIEQENAGSISLKEGGKYAPGFFNPKLMTGVGFSLGPVVIDIPITFYVGDGYSVGLTAGIVW